MKSTSGLEMRELSLEGKLEVCAREEIHLAGRIQAHGILLAMSLEDLRIHYAAESLSSYLPLEVEDVLGTLLTDWVGPEDLEMMHQVLGTKAFTYNNPLELSLQVQGQTFPFHGVVHSNEKFLILELEIDPTEEISHESGVDAYFRLTSDSLSSIQEHHQVHEIAQIVARDLKSYTKFDRVMVYRFDPDFNGQVIAEAKEDHLEAFLNLRYPASDIPPQARELYRKNPLRLIRSVHDQGVPLVGLKETALDLTWSTLRAVSPIHLTYLKNMGVEASMSISLLTPEGELWGLVACHHYQGEKFLPYKMRAACTHYAMMLAPRMVEREKSLQREEEAQRRKVLPNAIRLLSEDGELSEKLVGNDELFLGLLGGEGLAVVVHDEVQKTGKTPSAEEVLALDHLLEDLDSEGKISLYHSFPKGFHHQSDCAGCLRIRISSSWSVLVFRQELIEHVQWGGNPDDPVIYKEELGLQPRASFDSFTRLVQGYCKPWTPIDETIALEFHSSLAAFVIRKAQHLEQLNTELHHRNSEIQQFAYSVSHDLKSPLVTISGYVQAIDEDLQAGELHEVADSLNRIKSAVSRMGRLIEGMLTFSRIGKQDLESEDIDMKQLLQQIRKDFESRHTEQGLELELPGKPLPIYGIREDITRIFQNLIENATKYIGEDHKSPEIIVSCSESKNSVIYQVKDNGPGIATRHHERVFRLFERLHSTDSGTGIGLATVMRTMQQHQGSVTLQSEEGQGALFRLEFPKQKSESA